jgi:hypothetical protein
MALAKQILCNMNKVLRLYCGTEKKCVSKHEGYAARVAHV